MEHKDYQLLNFKVHIEKEVDGTYIITVPELSEYEVRDKDMWKALEKIKETLYINSQPGLAEQILGAAAEPIEAGIPAEEFDWGVPNEKEVAENVLANPDLPVDFVKRLLIAKKLPNEPFDFEE